MPGFLHEPDVQVWYGSTSWEGHGLHFGEIIFCQIILRDLGVEHILHDE